MADSKLEIKVGSITFSGEGTGEWLSKQLDKVLAKIPELIAVAPQDNGESGGKNGAQGGGGTPSTKASGTLAAFLKSTGSTSKQVRKFLAAATWLHDAEGKHRVTTAEVSKALNTHNQGRLSNPSDALNQNVGKGHCVKDGKSFYVTPEGRASLGK